MRRTTLAPLGALLVAALVSDPAAAQFGNIFGFPPPRPPSDVPGQRPFPQQFPPQREFPQSRNFPQEPPQDFPTVRGRSPVRSEPLPPPPGARQAIPQPDAGSEQSGRVGRLPPDQRQPRGMPQSGDDIAATPPSQKIENSIAVFAGLDKITGRITSFDVAIGETVQFGALQVVPRACYTRPPTEAPNTDAFAEVSEVTLQGEVRKIFSGWMFAASPGLHAVEHPIYDIWLTDCKGAPQVAEAPVPTAAGTAPAPVQQPQPLPRPRPRQQPQPQEPQPTLPSPRF